jgi:hypothetical protein
MRPTPIAMRRATNGFEALTVGGGNVYTGQITATSDLYIFAFFSRVF